MRLFLCEKPSQGRDIAKSLGATQRGNGYYEGAGSVVTWCIGHLVETAPPEAYDEALKKWSLQTVQSGQKPSIKSHRTDHSHRR